MGGLGKGLSALISDDNLNQIQGGYISALSVEKIKPNRYQPRINIEDQKLRELAESIKEHGVIEPIIVTRLDDGNFELIAGERRFKAAILAGKNAVPAVVKEASPQQMLELAVVENIQRADLNPLEEGLAFQQLISEFGLTHSDISDKVSLSRSAVANKIRLLNLPEEVKKGLLLNQIDEGHARAILGLTDPSVMSHAYRITVRDNLSVRAVEELVRRLNQGHKKNIRKNERIVDKKTQILEGTLKKFFNEKVTLSRSLRGGKIVIPFKNDKELEDIIHKINV